MHRIASALHIPQEILVWVGSLLTASLALIGTAFQAIVPPDVTAEWPIYGVLISAVIVLFLSTAGILRWVATKWLSQQAATTTAIVENSQALCKVASTLETQNKWFEEFGKSALQMHLDHARLSIHHQPQHEPERKRRRDE